MSWLSRENRSASGVLKRHGGAVNSAGCRSKSSYEQPDGHLGLQQKTGSSPASCHVAPRDGNCSGLCVSQFPSLICAVDAKWRILYSSWLCVIAQCSINHEPTVTHSSQECFPNIIRIFKIFFTVKPKSMDFLCMMDTNERCKSR